MAAWFEMTQEELAADTQAQQERRLAYFNTFYADEDGRAVLADIHRFVLCRYPDGQEYALASLSLIELYLYIRANSGIGSLKEVVDAEASTINLGTEE